MNMMIELTLEEVEFVKEALRYARMDFESKAAQYMDIEGYRQTQYLPKLKMFDSILGKLSK